MAIPAALELVSVTKRYDTTLAVDAVNLKIPAGTYCCLLGPSGCGKTSTLRMIAGHEAVSEGDIILGPHNVTDLQPAKRGIRGYIYREWYNRHDQYWCNICVRKERARSLWGGSAC